MSRFPYLKTMPKRSKTKVDTKTTPPVYNANQVYIQMGSALKASDNARMALLRFAQMFEEADKVGNLPEAALLERVRKIEEDVNNFEKILVKFQVGHTRGMAQLGSAAAQHVRTSLGWFKKFLESHSEEDALKFAPVLEKLASLSKDIEKVRVNAADNAMAMEDRYSEKRDSLRRTSSQTKRRNWPDPVRPDPATALSSEEIGPAMEAVVNAIDLKESATQEEEIPKEE